MACHDYFELRRLSDGLVYQFDRMQRPDGQVERCCESKHAYYAVIFAERAFFIYTASIEAV
jgi:hypothetical protein